MYQALYRKWRPQTFDDVVGQPQVTEILKNQISSDTVSHAYLFIGTRGTGKTTCAKILAKAVNCESPVNGNPCNCCKSCRGIDDGTILDVEELDAASNNGVDNVRALRDEAIYSPASVRKRVYIVDEVHMLSMPAFNALLKILEEPPEHLMFILATTELHKVPATILSRCQRYSFKRLPPDVIASRLQFVAQKENLQLMPEAALMLGRLAEGSMRDGLSILDQCAGRGAIDQDLVRSVMGLAGGVNIAEMLFSIVEGNTAKALALFGEMWQEGKDPATLLEELCSLERDALIAAIAPKGGNPLLSGAFSEAILNEVCDRLSPARLMSDIEKLQSSLSNLRNVQNPRTAAELCLIAMSESIGGNSLAELTSRVERLESGTVIQMVKEPVSAKNFPQTQNTSIHEPEVFAHENEQKLSTYLDEQTEAPVMSPDENQCVDDNQTAEDDGCWLNILAEARSNMSIGTFNMISDSAAVIGTLNGDVLSVGFKNGFAKMMLNKPDILEGLRVAANHVTGRTIRIQAEEITSSPAPQQEDKLSGLAKFGVTFE